MNKNKKDENVDKSEIKKKDDKSPNKDKLSPSTILNENELTLGNL